MNLKWDAIIFHIFLKKFIFDIKIVKFKFFSLTSFINNAINNALFDIFYAKFELNLIEARLSLPAASPILACQPDTGLPARYWHASPILARQPDTGMPAQYWHASPILACQPDTGTPARYWHTSLILARQPNNCTPAQ